MLVSETKKGGRVYAKLIADDFYALRKLDAFARSTKKSRSKS